MSDIDRLTLVIACLGLMMLAEMPEGHNVKNWSFTHLTFSLLTSFIFLSGVLIPVFHIIRFGGY